jgi:hypothetical protein
MFEKASKLKLRFQTSKGILTVEDLWDLTLPQLNKIAKDLNSEIKKDSEEDFLNDRSEVDTILQLRFSIVRHIMEVKKVEVRTSQESAMNKEHNQSILRLIAEKEAEELKSLSAEELRKLLK